MYVFKPPHAIESVPSLSGHAIAYTDNRVAKKMRTYRIAQKMRTYLKWERTATVLYVFNSELLIVDFEGTFEGYLYNCLFGHFCV